MISAESQEEASRAETRADSLLDPANSVHWQYYLALAAVMALVIAPLWIARFDPLVDYPMHLARACVLKDYDRVEFFQKEFERIRVPIPNLAMDVLVPPLLGIFAPETAGKIFLSVTVVLFVLGCHLLALGIHGRPSWLALLSGLLAYHSAFLYGFTNFSFSLALFLTAFAFWIKVREHPSAAKRISLAALAVAVYLAHLAGFLFLTVGVVWLTAWKLLQEKQGYRRALLDLSLLVAPVALQLYPWTDKVSMGSIVWASFREKVVGVGGLFLSYEYWLDGLLLLAIVSTFALLAWRGWTRFALAYFWLGILFFLLFLMCPKQATVGGGSGADNRFVLPATLLILLSTTVSAPRRWARPLGAIVLVFLLAHWGEIGWHWSRLGAKTARLMTALDQVRPESRIYVLYHTPDNPRENKLARANLHVASYAVMRKHSISGDFYAVRGVEPIFFRDAGRFEDSETQPSQILHRDYLDRRLSEFDYVWGCYLESNYRSYLTTRGHLVSSADECSLWALEPLTAVRP